MFLGMFRPNPTKFNIYAILPKKVLLGDATIPSSYGIRNNYEILYNFYLMN